MFYLKSMFPLSRFKQSLDFIPVNIFISITLFLFLKNKKNKLKQHNCIESFSI